MRLCIFCGSTTRKITNEHVFGEWIGRLFGAGQGKRFENEIGENFKATHVWNALTVDVKVKIACKVCNHGWMSDLEKVVEPIITPMARGRRRVLSLRDQIAITSWAMKICMVQEWLPNVDERFFSEEQRRALMSYAIPVEIGARIWAARFGDDNRGAYSLQTTLGLPSGPALGYISTFAVGEFALQVLVERFPPGTRPLSAIRLGPWDRVLIPIWPPSRFADIDPRGLVWPPGLSVTEKGFVELYERFKAFGPQGTRNRPRGPA